MEAKGGKDIATLSLDMQDDLARMWASYVDRGVDFGTAGSLVVRDIHP